MPNATMKAKSEKRALVGDEIDGCSDMSSVVYRRPCDRGYLVNWDLELEIWHRAFTKHMNNVQPAECGLLLTQPAVGIPTLNNTTMEVVFEHQGFQSLHLTHPAALALHHYKSTHPASVFGHSCAHMVVDSGYSFTHITPYYDLCALNYATKRINVGGKVLTNYLKEIVSFRQWNMMEETYLMNVIKERLCYCSLDLAHDLKIARLKEGNTIRREYVLPDYVTGDRTGHVKGEKENEKPHTTNSSSSNNAHTERGRGEHSTETKKDDSGEQILVMNNERIVVPELLFNPSIIGVPQAGVAEAIVQSVSSTATDLHGLLYANVLLTGGNALIPHFKQRVLQDLRRLVPDKYQVNVFVPDDPITAAWKGGSKLAVSPGFGKIMVSKEEYREYGPTACLRRFIYY